MIGNERHFVCPERSHALKVGFWLSKIKGFNCQNFREWNFISGPWVRTDL